MTDSTLNRAIEFIERGERFAVAIAEKPTFDCLAAAEVMANYLGSRGKQTGLLSQPSGEAQTNDVFPRLTSLPPLPRELIISLDTAASPVSQLRYEKGDSRIDIILSPTSSQISEGHIAFRKGRVFCDSIISFGVPDIESLRLATEIDPEFFLKNPVLNIDNSPDNKNYGEVNLLEKDTSLSEVVYKLLALANGENLTPENATTLLAGILSHSQGFTASQPTPDSLLYASELVRLGADWERAQGLWKSYTPLSLMQLFGRASVRSRADADRGVTWTFLTSEDFEKTGRAPKDTSSVLDYFRSHMPPHKITSLLWQDPGGKSVNATLSGDGQTLGTLSLQEPGEFRSPHFALDKKFASFAEAEAYVASLLKEIL